MHPQKAVIKNVLLHPEARKRSLRYHDLNTVICLAYFRGSSSMVDNTKAASLEPSYPMGTDSPVWWNAGDGEVDFENALGRWWLAGREVEAYECL